MKTGKEKGVQCPFCEDRRELPFKFRNVKEHLICVQLGEGHIHVHGPVKDKVLIAEFIRAIAKESGIEIED